MYGIALTVLVPASTSAEIAALQALNLLASAFNGVVLGFNISFELHINC